MSKDKIENLQKRYEEIQKASLALQMESERLAKLLHNFTNSSNRPDIIEIQRKRLIENMKHRDGSVRNIIASALEKTQAPTPDNVLSALEQNDYVIMPVSCAPSYKKLLMMLRQMDDKILQLQNRKRMEAMQRKIYRYKENARKIFKKAQTQPCALLDGPNFFPSPAILGLQWDRD